MWDLESERMYALQHEHTFSFRTTKLLGNCDILVYKKRDVTTAPSTAGNQKASRTGPNILGEIYQALVSSHQGLLILMSFIALTRFTATSSYRTVQSSALILQGLVVGNRSGEGFAVRVAPPRSIGMSVAVCKVMLPIYILSGVLTGNGEDMYE
ncbi:hypothetical protein ARMGADRAFT_605341 [Armillaria gallica]|uniref:Uncharacterized protein n=1 Tax=Armillaria gallica TaxID=47427 RepID=A0A2H3DAH0_ARMGA|nr:hypothetical protein ARMGADRAFT_605341 [Armillaria gallica]